MTRGLYIESYGCQMNVYDALMMEDLLRPVGYAAVSRPEDADIILINTCHIREKASEKLYSTLGRMRVIKKEECILIVAGCVAQAEGEAVFERAPYVNVVVGPQGLHTLPELIMKVKRDKKQINIEFPVVSKFDAISIDRKANGGVSAYVSIQEGCDKFCTFCVVPYTRGPEYSRDVEAILEEVKQLTDRGTKEIVLIGQNVNAYHGTYKGNEWDLGKLIQKVSLIDGVERIRYTTSHPRDMHPSLYEAHRDEKKLAPFVHLPVQSGSDAILRKMNRKHTAEEYLRVVEQLKDSNKNMALSSDFIVGFPGETEKDFEETMKLVESVGFALSYSFKYSPRPGTPGAEYSNQVPEEEKSARLAALQGLLTKQQLQFNKSMEGRVMDVLVGDPSSMRGDRIFGKSEYTQSIYISSPSGSEDCFNRMVRVEILHGRQNSLEGTVLSNAN
ncbi:tRNA (N6-isopentenyl adenosine(37)-C2)-methylthiotransferase MiaB [Anaplasma phagocytophilum str. Norway variant2]|uniref:tRNA-2-methylthio-N(6)-dimethylallyladenosine synthase n=1 Tax=Anaplasma phagocytophilum str. Norway variant2 TaxID=1392507 RepID=A0A161IGU0_ANAPH|nr:tRNA (N6-isopentenyl adenosine(37)-C2)-methylthiotransferase MiaB [Anaplasma phagocytophilum]ANC34419.1 tRNA (N6-isopentenyl adenosine(37)-C2)-methylthiotransferase MiaB [Anaplasma phagocytophilum str. Norway variant2]